jgi:two-component system response regulator HydG
MTIRPATLLLVDDEPNILDQHFQVLEGEGYRLVKAVSAADAVKAATEEFFDLLVLDDRLDERGSGLSGRDVLKACRERDPDVGAIFVSGYNDPDRLIEVLRLGAADYLVKNQRDFNTSFRTAIRRVLEQTDRMRQWRWLRSRFARQMDDSILIGESEAMQRVKELIRRVAKQDQTAVLITGETGTGKELVAAELHRLSPRFEKDHPIKGHPLTCNVAALEPSLMTAELFGAAKGAFTGAGEAREGFFAVANNGTLFLDEIGDLPRDCQPRLLRVLENGQYHRVGETQVRHSTARVVAATNRDLRQAAREDFFQRFPYRIELPPLRERGDDIELLAAYLLNRLAERQQRPVPTIDPSAMKALRKYHWPGNVRELRGALERALLYCDGDRITTEMLQFSEPPGSSQLPLEQLSQLNYEAACRRFEQSYWQGVLRSHNGNKAQAARHAGLHRTTLYDKLTACGLTESADRRDDSI